MSLNNSPFLSPVHQTEPLQRVLADEETAAKQPKATVPLLSTVSTRKKTAVFRVTSFISRREHKKKRKRRPRRKSPLQTLGRFQKLILRIVFIVEAITCLGFLGICTWGVYSCIQTYADIPEAPSRIQGPITRFQADVFLVTNALFVLCLLTCLLMIFLAMWSLAYGSWQNFVLATKFGFSPPFLAFCIMFSFRIPIKFEHLRRHFFYVDDKFSASQLFRAGKCCGIDSYRDFFNETVTRGRIAGNWMKDCIGYNCGVPLFCCKSETRRCNEMNTNETDVKSTSNINKKGCWEAYIGGLINTGNCWLIGALITTAVTLTASVIYFVIQFHKFLKVQPRKRMRKRNFNRRKR